MRRRERHPNRGLKSWVQEQAQKARNQAVHLDIGEQAPHLIVVIYYHICGLFPTLLDLRSKARQHCWLITSQTRRSPPLAGRIDKKHAGLLATFDRLRRKRNIALYNDTGLVSHHDAEQALKSAADYLNVIRS